MSDDHLHQQRRVDALRTALDSILASVPDSGEAPDSSETRDLMSALEYLLPDLLAARYPAWKHLALDGILPRHTVIRGDGLEIVGICVLIDDQTTVPLVVSVERRSATAIRVAVRIGEADEAGKLRRVPYGDRMHKLADRVASDPGQIPWLFHVDQVVR